MRKAVLKVWQDAANELAALSHAEFSLACANAKNNRIYGVVCAFLEQLDSKELSVTSTAVSVNDEPRFSLDRSSFNWPPEDWNPTTSVPVRLLAA